MAIQKKMRVGLTGGIGAGKSAVLSLLQKRGIPVLQTDQIAHELLQEKSVVKELVRQFGNTILNPSGLVSRSKLSRIVFQNRKRQKKLNGILHPAVRKRVAEWTKRQLARQGVSLVVVEVPLIFEGGYHRAFDGVLGVSAPRELRAKRLLKRGWGPLEMRRRERFQWSQTRKNRNSDWVIFNQSTRKDLKCAVDQWLKKIQFRRDAAPSSLKSSGAIRPQ